MPDGARGRTGRLRAAAVLAAVVGPLASIALVALAAIGYFWAPTTAPDQRVLEWWTLAWVGFPLAGAMIAAKRPGTRIGWLLIGIGAAMAVSRATSIYLHRALVTLPGELPAGDALVAGLATVRAIGDIGAFVLLGAMLLHFPADRLRSPRWRLAIWGAVAAMAAIVVGRVIGPELRLDDGTMVANPVAVAGLGGLASVLEASLIVIGIFLLAALGELVWRARRANAVERQQLKWLAYPAAVFLVVAVPLGVSVQEVDVQDVALIGRAVAWVALFVVCFNGIAAAIGIAVLRYRLYDIDRVASRTASYGIVTAILAGVYVLGVVGVARVVPIQAIGAGEDLLVAASTLAVAALFIPVRRRVQRVVDRRFNRANYDAARTVEAFSQRLRDEVDLDTLTEQLCRTTVDTVQPAGVSVWIRAV